MLVVYLRCVCSGREVTAEISDARHSEEYVGSLDGVCIDLGSGPRGDTGGKQMGKRRRCEARAGLRVRKLDAFQGTRGERVIACTRDLARLRFSSWRREFASRGGSSDNDDDDRWVVMVVVQRHCLFFPISSRLWRAALVRPARVSLP